MDGHGPCFALLFCFAFVIHSPCAYRIELAGAVTSTLVDPLIAGAEPVDFDTHLYNWLHGVK